MGKRISVILIVVLAAAAVTFGVLWQSALRDHSDIKALVQAGANEACSRFSDFQKRETTETTGAAWRRFTPFSRLTSS